MTWVQRQIDDVRETAARLRWQHVVVTLVRCLGLVALLCYGWHGFTHYVVVPFVEHFAQQGPLSQAGHHAGVVGAVLERGARDTVRSRQDRGRWR